MSVLGKKCVMVKVDVSGVVVVRRSGRRKGCGGAEYIPVWSSGR